MAFEDAATVFLDPLATTFPDPDHSVDEYREITTGYTMKGNLAFVSHCQRGERIRIVSAQRAPNAIIMKKQPAAKIGDDLRPEYDLSQLKGGVRGKYYSRATAGTNLVLIDPDLAELFPDAKAVNGALRVIAGAAQSATASKRRRTR